MKTFKILVVDDSEVMRKAIINLMEEELSFEYEEAKDGIEAMEHYKSYKPDLVTLDINMPKQDGIETLKQIMGFDNNAKVVMLTTEAEKAKIVESVSLGAKSYIIKPMDKVKAIAKLKMALNI
jgi:two-component system chemotaxis response regulator CheY